MSEELKACPFCGKQPDIFVIEEVEFHTRWGVECQNCGATIQDDFDESDLEKAWNTRPIEDALRARIAELEAAQEWVSREGVFLDENLMIDYATLQSSVSLAIDIYENHKKHFNGREKVNNAEILNKMLKVLRSARLKSQELQ